MSELKQTFILEHFFIPCFVLVVVFFMTRSFLDEANTKYNYEPVLSSYVTGGKNCEKNNNLHLGDSRSIGEGLLPSKWKT